MKPDTPKPSKQLVATILLKISPAQRSLAGGSRLEFLLAGQSRTAASSPFRNCRPPSLSGCYLGVGRASLALCGLLLAGAGCWPASAQTGVPPAASDSYTPLSSSERWREYRDDTWLSPGFYAFALAAAADSQSVWDPPEWGQGAAAYARRSASWLGVFGVEETIHHGGAAALGYDPRYLRCGCKGFFRRSGHAIKWSFVTKNTAGQTRLDLPVLAGAYGGGMLSTYWYPSRYQPLKDGVRVGHQEMGFVVGLNLINEFGPELKRVFTRRP